MVTKHKYNKLKNSINIPQSTIKANTHNPYYVDLEVKQEVTMT